MKDFPNPHIIKPHCGLTGIAKPSVNQARLRRPHYHYEHDRRKSPSGFNEWNSTCYHKTVAPSSLPRKARPPNLPTEPFLNIKGKSGYIGNGARYFLFIELNPLTGDPEFTVIAWYKPYTNAAFSTSWVGSSGTNLVRAQLPGYPAPGKHSMVHGGNNKATVANPITTNIPHLVATTRTPGPNTTDTYTKLYVNEKFEPGYLISGGTPPNTSNANGGCMTFNASYIMDGELYSITEVNRVFSDKELYHVFQRDRHKVRK